MIDTNTRGVLADMGLTPLNMHDSDAELVGINIKVRRDQVAALAAEVDARGGLIRPGQATTVNRSRLIRRLIDCHLPQIGSCTCMREEAAV